MIHACMSAKPITYPLAVSEVVPALSVLYCTDRGSKTAHRMGVWRAVAEILTFPFFVV